MLCFSRYVVNSRYAVMICLTCGHLALGCTTQNSSQAKVVDIWLGKSSETVAGITWPTFNGRKLSLAQFVGHYTVNVNMPSGKTVSVETYSLSITERDGVVAYVTLTPLEKPVAFKDALTALERSASTLGIDKQDLVRQRIEEWKRVSPMFSVSTGGDLPGGGSVYYAIKPRRNRVEWILVIDLSQ